jgi:transcription antitermination factor NusG
MPQPARNHARPTPAMVVELHQGKPHPMPILPAEPALFPEQVFTMPTPPDLAHRRWWVLQARPRQEKSLARRLHERGCPFFLPLIPRRLRVRGRILTSYVPLFSGYVFLLADGEERAVALATNRVVRSLVVADQEELWRDLRQIDRLIALGAPITPEQQLAPGTPVEIRSGPLAGLRGKVIRSASGHRFVVQVNFIQEGASVLLDDVNLVRVLESSPARAAGCA